MLQWRSTKFTAEQEYFHENSGSQLLSNECKYKKNWTQSGKQRLCIWKNWYTLSPSTWPQGFLYIPPLTLTEIHSTEMSGGVQVIADSPLTILNQEFFWQSHFIHFTLHTKYCMLYIVHCTPCTLKCTIYTAHYMIFYAYCALYTADCTLQTAHCTLHTSQ